MVDVVIVMAAASDSRACTNRWFRATGTVWADAQPTNTAEAFL
jgi:hypothetical protein